MGGYSSGRGRTINRGSVEQAQRIDMRRLRQLGFIQDGAAVSGALRWTWHGDETCSVDLSVRLADPGCRRLCLTYGHAGEAVSQTVDIVAHPCRYGGHRFYFLCPMTSARVEVLAFSGGRFVSLKAARLAYQCQSETRLDRLYRARRKAEARALGKAGHPRPRGRNRERLVNRWNDVEAAAADLFVEESIRRFGLLL